MSYRRTFRTEIAPAVYLATEAVAIVDYHEDEEPCVSVKYRSHHFENDDGSRFDETLWPALRACMRDVKRGLEDPHWRDVEAWADSIYDQLEAQRASGTEAPVFSGDRDQREVVP